MNKLHCVTQKQPNIMQYIVSVNYTDDRKRVTCLPM